MSIRSFLRKRLNGSVHFLRPDRYYGEFTTPGRGVDGGETLTGFGEKVKEVLKDRDKWLSIHSRDVM